MLGWLGAEQWEANELPASLVRDKRGLGFAPVAAPQQLQWRELGGRLQRAAAVLGFDADTWDARGTEPRRVRAGAAAAREVEEEVREARGEDSEDGEDGEDDEDDAAVRAYHRTHATLGKFLRAFEQQRLRGTGDGAGDVGEI